MPRKDRQGRELGAYLAAALGLQKITDLEIADAMGKTAPTYNRHKKLDQFPTFEDLGLLAEHYADQGLIASHLRYDFGFYDETEMRELRDHLGAQHPFMPAKREETTKKRTVLDKLHPALARPPL